MAAANAMNIIILDDYQDAVRKLACAQLLEPLNAKVFTNTVKGIGQLSVRLRDADRFALQLAGDIYSGRDLLRVDAGLALENSG